MRVCVFMCVCMRVHPHICVCFRVCVCVCMYVCVRVCVPDTILSASFSIVAETSLKYLIPPTSIFSNDSSSSFTISMMKSSFSAYKVGDTLLKICQKSVHIVVVCCSVLQCVAVCCSVLQCVAVCCSVTPPLLSRFQ